MKLLSKPPVRIELTTPGLQDQCSNHWAMEALDGVVINNVFIQFISVCGRLSFLVMVTAVQFYEQSEGNKSITNHRDCSFFFLSRKHACTSIILTPLNLIFI